MNRRTALLCAALLLAAIPASGCTAGTTTGPAAGTTSAPAPASTKAIPTPATAPPAPATTAPAPAAPPAQTLPPAPAATLADVPAAGSAAEAAASLPERTWVEADDYRRSEFGPSWDDVDGNGCDTRNDVLARDLTGTTVDSRCRILTGTLADPYTGTTITFTRGQDTSNDVQIDHVVALGDAWYAGAREWDGATRTAFANDPFNLLAVDGSANTAKGARTADRWLPPNEAYRCDYAARQVAVKKRYGLTVTASEHTALINILSACPATKLPG